MRFLKKSNLHKIVSIILFTSGIINILSVSVRPLSVREGLLLEIVPSDVIYASKFVTLMLGIFLGITAVNLYRRKRRSLILASILSFLSILFHLTKGLDYEEAVLFSFVLILLFLSRKEYYVKSEVKSYKHVIITFAVSFSFILLYGVFGFWLLDKKGFGVNFTLWQSITHTIEQILLTNNTQFVPRTHYAGFFVDSLQVSVIFIIGYICSLIFAPVASEFIKNAKDTNNAKNLVKDYGRTALDYFKIWSDKVYFFPKDKKAFISYGVASGAAVSLGDPVGSEKGIFTAISEFYNYCTQNGWKCCFYQVLPNYLKLYKTLGFKHFKVGDEAIVDLIKFEESIENNKPRKKVVNWFGKHAYKTERIEPPLSKGVMGELKEVSDDWLCIKKKKERSFTLGYFDKKYVSSTPVFVVKDPKGEIIAFANIIHSGAEGESTVDLMRHKENSPNGTMDFLFIKLFLHLRKRSFTRFTLGLAPLSGFRVDEKSTRAEKIVHQFAQNNSFLFSFKGLKTYKSKYANYWEPRYLIYKNIIDLPAIARALNELSKYSG